MDVEDFLIALACIFAAGLAVFGLAISATADDGRQKCIDKHEICIDTTDGWKPYVEAPK